MSAAASISLSSGRGAVRSAVARAWRRRLMVLVVAESGLALAIVFGALSLLLLLGTQILAWPWIFGIAAFAAGWTVWAVRKRMAGRYLVAQMLDRRLLLNDTLSTAWFLETRSADADFDRYSSVFPFEQAERLAQTADAAAAFPFERRWSWLTAGGFLALAAGLFAARYLVMHDLNLERAFLPAPMVQVVEYVENALAPHRPEETLASGKRDMQLPLNRPGEEAMKPAKPEPPTAGQPQSNGKAGTGKGGSSAEQSTEQANGKPNQSAGSSTSGEGKNAKGAEPSSQPPGTAPKQPTGAAAQNAQTTGKSESVMDRMREAVSSAMNKLKPANPSESQKPADGQKPGDPKGDHEQAEGKNQPTDSQTNSAEEQPSRDQSSSQQQGQGSAKSQASGKDSSQTSSKNGADSQSGVGHSDGDKAIKEAEQAKAMGKIAEIIGKRSASLTGDMHIEPGSNQKLQTADTHRQGKHADLGGEINRDEISVEDQAYVREYMELVRKKAAKNATVPH